jgi:hypothetical protein
MTTLSLKTFVPKIPRKKTMNMEKIINYQLNYQLIFSQFKISKKKKKKKTTIKKYSYRLSILWQAKIKLLVEYVTVVSLE